MEIADKYSINRIFEFRENKTLRLIFSESRSLQIKRIFAKASELLQLLQQQKEKKFVKINLVFFLGRKREKKTDYLMRRTFFYFYCHF